VEISCVNKMVGEPEASLSLGAVDVDLDLERFVLNRRGREMWFPMLRCSGNNNIIRYTILSF
jgi:hypothetical protein